MSICAVPAATSADPPTIVRAVPDVLRPLFDQVVIKELEPDRMRKSGLLVPQGTHDLPPNEGIVLAAGDGPPDLADFKMPVKPGDHVVFPRSAGVWVEIEDERLLVCRVREILGVIEEGAAPSDPDSVSVSGARPLASLSPTPTGPARRRAIPPGGSDAPITQGGRGRRRPRGRGARRVRLDG